MSLLREGPSCCSRNDGRAASGELASKPSGLLITHLSTYCGVLYSDSLTTQVAIKLIRRAWTPDLGIEPERHFKMLFIQRPYLVLNGNRSALELSV
jgi:hypothetical protein